MRTSLSIAAALSVAFAVACAGGPGDLPPDATSGESEADAPPSGSGSKPGPANPPTETSPLDLDGVTRIHVARGYCGGAPGKCYGNHSFTIAMDTGALEKRVCVEGDAAITSDVTTRTLSADELQRVRDALAGIRTSSAPHDTVDGMMFGLVVTTGAGEKSYSPSATCNQSNFTKIASGWEALWNTVSAL